MAVSSYRAMHQLRKGGLHKALRMDGSQQIPDDRMDNAVKSKNGHVAEMAKFAKMRAAKKA